VLAWYFVYFAKDVEPQVGYCGGCHCIPDNSTSCPNTAPSRTTFSKEIIDAWKSQTAINPYTLDCNPFEDGTYCDTEPPLDSELLRLGDTAVCAVHYERSAVTSDNNQLCESQAYRLQTYPSWEEAEAAGGFVTHTGHCGVCSTMQDLAVYAEFLLPTSPGNFCRRQAVQSLENGIACYRGLGMTQDCARIWSDTSWNTATNCFTSCVIDPTLPQFGGEDDEEPQEQDNGTSTLIELNATHSEISMESSTNTDSACELSECLQCDEEVSAPLFERYAGRSRRRSGLLSTTAFPCSRFPYIVQDPCPLTIPLE